MTTTDNSLATLPSWNQTWTAHVNEGRLYISAGADRVYLVDELNSEQAACFYQAYQQNCWKRLLDQDPVFHTVTRNLLALGALYYSGATRKTCRVALRWAGRISSELANWLDVLFNRRGDIEAVSSPHEADLVLLIRTNGTLQQASEQVCDEMRPHLLVDLAYHSTLAIGPFVVPGQTACVGCLAGRLMHLWGDVQPPDKPAMNSHMELTGAIILEHLESFRSRGTINALVGNAWALDTSTWESRFHPVFRLPWCPVCEQKQQRNEAGHLNNLF